MVAIYAKYTNNEKYNKRERERERERDLTLNQINYLKLYIRGLLNLKFGTVVIHNVVHLVLIEIRIHNISGDRH